MPTDSINILSAVLVCAGVAAKLVTASMLGSQNHELKDLENECERRRRQLEDLQQQHVSAEENLEFYERRKEEGIEERAALEQELKELFELERKHLKSLGYDPDEEGVHAYVPSEHDEAGAGPEQDGARGLAIAVLPADLGNADKLFLPDAIVSQLLDMGEPVQERSLLAQRLRDQGEDLAIIVEKEEYFKLAATGGLKAVVVVNSLMQGAGVASATCRVVQIPSGSILLSTTYEQPGTHESSPDYHRLSQTARLLAESIHDAFQLKTTPANVAPNSG